MSYIKMQVLHWGTLTFIRLACNKPEKLYSTFSSSHFGLLQPTAIKLDDIDNFLLSLIGGNSFPLYHPLLPIPFLHLPSIHTLPHSSNSSQSFPI